MRAIRISFIVLGAAALLLACAIDPGPFFTPPATPEHQPEFNSGNIGLLTPTLTKENELIAFRFLSGLKPPTALGGQTSAASNVSVPDGAPSWINARRSITDLPAAPFPNTYRSSAIPGQFVYYENCLPAAFDTAARTFENRRSAYGSAAALKAWVIAQDQVFTDCSSEMPVYPEPLPASASQLQRADRDYQIAAAHFYSQDYGQAEARFRKIADDIASPWHQMAPYLVARVLLREYSIKNDAEALPRARLQLVKVANDKSPGSMAESAKRMIEHIDAVEHPEATMTKLSDAVLAAQSSFVEVQNAIDESAYVLRATSFQPTLGKPDLPEAFDWVRTLETGNLEHATQRWRAAGSIPWFTIAIMYANGKSEAAQDLLSQADALSDSSPAFGTASYNAVRLHIERGEDGGARAQLDRLLARVKDEPDSLVNGWRAERMRVATSFDDFLRWAARKPIGADEFVGAKPNADSAVLAYDSAYVLNGLTPLTKLNYAAHSKLLPDWSAVNIAIAGWTRAFMLDDLKTVRETGTIVAKTHPEWRSSLVPSRGDGNEWKFRAALLIAQYRDLQPAIPVRYRIDVGWPGSWWCAVEPARTRPGVEQETISWKLPVVFTPSKEVLSQQDLDAASDEINRLHQKGSAEMFIAPIIFDWAKKHAADPLVPEALHRLVVVTRYGCRNGDPAIGRISKTAFDMLHTQYPNSSWAAKTPYWFK